jgi:hypothetical protein
VYNLIEVISNEPRNLVEPEAKLIPLTDIYITANFSGLIQALQLKVAKLN